MPVSNPGGSCRGAHFGLTKGDSDTNCCLSDRRIPARYRCQAPRQNELSDFRSGHDRQLVALHDSNLKDGEYSSSRSTSRYQLIRYSRWVIRLAGASVNGAGILCNRPATLIAVAMLGEVLLAQPRLVCARSKFTAVSPVTVSGSRPAFLDGTVLFRW